MNPDLLGERIGIDDIFERFLRGQERSAGLRPINMCMASSYFDVRSYVDLGLTANDHDPTRYDNPLGREDLRVALGRFHAERTGVEIPPERFLITDGGLGALLLAFGGLLGPGDELILPAIFFPPYKVLARLFRARCVFAPLNDRGTFDLPALRRCITSRTRAILLNSPSNPLGSVLTRAELEEIATLGVDVISDEVYDAFGHDAPVPSMTEVHRDAMVINSFSKTFALPGLRLGYLIMPERYTGRFWNIKATVNVCTSAPAQALALRVLAARATIVSAHRAYVKEHRDLLVRECRARGLRLKLPPVAGFYAILDVSHHRQNTLRMAEELVDHHNLAVFPATDFAEEDPRFIRLNLASTREDLLETLDRLQAYLGGGPHA